MTLSYLDSALFFLLTTTIANPLHAGLLLLLLLLAVAYFHPGGLAWAVSGSSTAIPGPPGTVLALARENSHHALARLATACRATRLMAFSVGLTRFIVASHPDTAKEILTGPAFADRPVKEAASELMFHRAMGFAPHGEYWRKLRRIAATYVLSPKRVSALGGHRKAIGEGMIRRIGLEMARGGVVGVRRVLHIASLNNVMVSVFGVSFDRFDEGVGLELEEMVREGYELLGAFNWADHVPLLRFLDVHGVRRRCRRLASRVRVFVARIIEEHRRKQNGGDDFVDVLLGLEEAEKLSDSDMVAVLWEMIFRGTDTVAILLEWILARMALHQDIQSKAQAEIDAAVGGSPGCGRAATDADIPNLPYLQSIVKECLRMHPPGPLLSWARLATQEAYIDGGRAVVPAGTTAMVNMWAIARNEDIWLDPGVFRPERFLEEEVSVMGSDLRLAPFGAGRRTCPGKALALTTVHLWLAQLLQSFMWVPSDGGVDLSERLNMSLEMKNPLACMALPRTS